MNSKQIRREIRAMASTLSAIEVIELAQYIIGGAKESTRIPKATCMWSEEYEVDWKNTEGSTLNEGFSSMFLIDSHTNPKDLTNYYASI